VVSAFYTEELIGYMYFTELIHDSARTLIKWTDSWNCCQEWSF